MSSPVSAVNANHSVDSLLSSATTLIPAQQNFLKQNYSINVTGSENGLSSWQGSYQLAAQGDTSPLITYGPQGKPIERASLKIAALPGFSFGNTTDAIPETWTNGVLVPETSAVAKTTKEAPPAVTSSSLTEGGARTQGVPPIDGYKAAAQPVFGLGLLFNWLLLGK